MKPSLLLGACVALVLTFTAAAQTGKPPRPAETEAVDFFQGEWSCTGKMPASELFGPEQKTATRVQVSKELSGHAFLFRISFKALGPQGMAANILSLWYYDGVSKEFVSPSVDDMGATFLQKSKGFEGGVIAFTGTGSLMGKKVDPAFDRFTKNADGTVAHLYEGTIDGKKIVFVDEVCKKVGKK